MPKLSLQEERALGALATRIRQHFGADVRSITLFGSRARGEGHADSDLDVLVRVAHASREARRALQDLAFDVGLEHGLTISPLLAADEHWRNDLPLGRAVEREGVAL